MIVAEIFASGDQEAAGAAGGIDDHILRTRRHHLDHQCNDVARGAELAVLPGGRNLRQHVFVEVALGVAILHRDFGEKIYYLCQQCGRWDGEARTFHMGGVRGASLGHVAQEGKHMLGNDFEHRSRVLVLQLGPAHFLIGDAATLADAILAFREDAPFDRLAEAVGLVLFKSMGVIQPAHEQEVSDLFDHFERIGDATRPKGIPYIVDLGAKFAGQHNTPEIHISRVAIPSISKRAKHSGPRIRFASQFFSSCAEMDSSSVSSRQFAAWPPRSPSDINGLRNRACCR